MNYTQSLNSALSGLMQSYYGGKAGAQSGEDAAYKRMQVESEIGRNSAAAQVDQGKLARMLEQRQFYQDPERARQMAEGLNSGDPVSQTAALLSNLFALPDNATAENVMGGQMKLWARGDTVKAQNDPTFRLNLNGAQAAAGGKLFDPIGETGYALDAGGGKAVVINEPLAQLYAGNVNSENTRNNRHHATAGVGSPKLGAERTEYFPTTLTGDAFLKTLSAADQAHVLAINDGREPYPTSKLILQPYYQRLLEAVARYNPKFDATKFNTRKTASSAFTTGLQGRQMLAFGSATGHLEELGRLVEALQGGNLPLFNALANKYSKQTGEPQVTNFDAAKAVVAKEVMKAIVAGGGGVEERQELSALMADIKSPQQLIGVIKTYRNLMQVQYDNLVEQYRAAGLDPSRLPDYSHSRESKNETKPQFPATQDAAAQQRRNANRLKAVQWLKGRNIQTQDQFRAAVQSLRDSGWSASEIQQIQQEAGL